MATLGWGAARKQTLTIAQSGQISDVLNTGSQGVLEGYIIGILAPSAVTGTITVQVCDLEAGTYRALQSNGVDVTIAAGKAAVLDPMPFQYLRLSSGSAEAAARAFVVLARSSR